MTGRVGPKARIDDLEVVFRDLFGIITVIFVKTFFKGVIHSVDGSLAIFVSIKSIDVGFLDEEE